MVCIAPALVTNRGKLGGNHIPCGYCRRPSVGEGKLDSDHVVYTS